MKRNISISVFWNSKILRKTTFDFWQLQLTEGNKPGTRIYSLATCQVPPGPSAPFFPKTSPAASMSLTDDVLQQQCPVSASPDRGSGGMWVASSLHCAHSSVECVALQGGSLDPTGLMSCSSWPHRPQLICKQPCRNCCCSEAEWVQSMGRI